MHRRERRWLLILPEVARNMPPPAVERAVTKHLEQTVARVIQLEEIALLLAAADWRESHSMRPLLRQADEVLTAVTRSSTVVREHVKEQATLQQDGRKRAFFTRPSQN